MSSVQRRMQWDVVSIVSFMIDAIINEHRLVDANDFVATLHMPPEAGELYAQDIKAQFQNML
eukprot:12020649-Prorocentrum_lima.AAC.1